MQSMVSSDGMFVNNDATSYEIYSSSSDNVYHPR